MAPQDNYGNEYTYRGSDTNSQSKSNHYCNRDFGSEAPNSNAYHYSNQNGSYYYSNPDGSTYYNSGNGSSTYTPPSQDSQGSQGSAKSSK
ncbi:hypothetical protein N7541_005412 [Penicillium brevicompactum]|uniref:Uncharacterized protein n=1 Tax=Penicillium brevicompactum TaxID=5074 RepID=A0A9W9UVM8_PENBR|nr:hypothetical protein N7541_005412 [Penicillium brevicompactum]